MFKPSTKAWDVNKKAGIGVYGNEEEMVLPTDGTTYKVEAVSGANPVRVKLQVVSIKLMMEMMTTVPSSSIPVGVKRYRAKG